ncbi:hypothetical protein [Halobacterium salinarum]|uniref:hypothetical protein n=1 Tax=Halobacterium salinarum TaxID=2242 RepID=UPI002556C8AA|nr:hypothetical protein [Halobacterium salinarum]MDL0135124.1 hypothetical protein [Halobacterium salinarum]
MTWLLDSETGEVIDHDGNVVATIEKPYRLPDDVHEVMRDTMEGNQPSAYNQSLLVDAATNNIEVTNRPG